MDYTHGALTEEGAQPEEQGTRVTKG